MAPPPPPTAEEGTDVETDATYDEEDDSWGDEESLELAAPEETESEREASEQAERRRRAMAERERQATAQAAPGPGITSILSAAGGMTSDGNGEGASADGGTGDLDSILGGAIELASESPTRTPEPVPAPETVTEKSVQKPDVTYADEGGFDLPDFPWPPERPSSRMRVDKKWLVTDTGVLTLGDIEARLTDALTAAGYYEQSFYAVPGGFALVTRLEGIDKDGKPLSDDLRYMLPYDEKPFSLTEFVGGLFFAPEGYYRFVTFVISDKPFMTSKEGLSEMDAVARLQEGASDLPSSIQDMAFGDKYNIDALIYEYRKPSGQASPELLRPGRLPPQTHMTNSGISNALEGLSISQN